MLATEARRLGFYPPKPQYKSQVWWRASVIPALRRQRQVDPGAQWPAGLLELTSASFIKRPCLKMKEWLRKEGFRHPPLSSTWILRKFCTHTHPDVHMHNTQADRQVDRHACTHVYTHTHTAPKGVNTAGKQALYFWSIYSQAFSSTRVKELGLFSHLCVYSRLSSEEQVWVCIWNLPTLMAGMGRRCIL